MDVNSPSAFIVNGVEDLMQTLLFHYCLIDIRSSNTPLAGCMQGFGIVFTVVALFSSHSGRTMGVCSS